MREMKAAALIVEHDTPDLLALCLASLQRFAPAVRPVVVRGYEGAEAHAVEIEAARRHQKLGDAEIVILLDTDVVIWSPRWIMWVEYWLGRHGLEAIGGMRHRGDISQILLNGQLILHAHCLAMTRNLFERVRSFTANGVLDTAWHVTQEAKGTLVLKPDFDGRVGIYRENRDLSRAPLWAHLGRGTSFRPRGPWRERARRLAARLGSPRAQKILSYQQDRAAFLRKGWEIVRA